jgi:hypothetical protein
METYTIRRIEDDNSGSGKAGEDSFWKAAASITSFVFPWNKETPPAMTFRSLRDTQNFYFRFDVIDKDIVVETGSDSKMSVLNSDRVEIFFRSGKEMNPYYGLEMDPLGRVLDYKATFYRKFDYSWIWPGKSIQAKYTADGYQVWGCIPIESLRFLNLLKNNKLELGLFRGKCLTGPDGSIDFKWISWKKPESETPDFHIPSAFGKLRL